MSATLDITLPGDHPWMWSWLPGLIGQEYPVDVALDGDTQVSRPARVIGAARIQTMNVLVLKVEIP